MVEIKIPGGRLRELETLDIPTLVKLSQTADFEDLYVIDQVSSHENYWRDLLFRQLDQRRPDIGIRTEYELPIEVDGIVNGVLGISIKPYIFSKSGYGGIDLHDVEVNYFIGQEFRRRGVAEQALRTIIPYSFEQLKAWRVLGICLGENTASRRLLEKVGMNQGYLGISRNHVAQGRQVAEYNLTLPEFNARKNAEALVPVCEMAS